MLVLNRKFDESIVIGEDIRITVVALSGDRVRLGIEAPPSVRVDRLEVREARMRDGEYRPRPASVMDDLVALAERYRLDLARQHADAGSPRQRARLAEMLEHVDGVLAQVPRKEVA